MSDYASKISALSPERRALLASHLKKKGGRYNIFPLSHAQRRLWFLDRLEPGSPQYNIPMAVRIQGRFDVSLFAAVLNEIVRRHEILRTTFFDTEDEPVQLVHAKEEIPISRCALSPADMEARESAIARHVAEEAAIPFDLTAGPLLRVRLVMIEPQSHVLILTMHHIVSDGWSMGVMLREISILYESLSNGQPSPLEPLPLQYADYAVWQRKMLTGNGVEEGLRFWKEKLRGVPPLLELPYDRPRPAVRHAHGDALGFAIEPEVSESLQEFCQKEGVTAFMVCLAAFAALLARYSRQDDLTIGMPVANRKRREFEGLIGFFVNTLVLRIDVSRAPSFRTLVQRVRDATLEALSHQDVPFEMVVDAAEIERSMSHTPLFQVMFTLQSVADQRGNRPLSAAGVTLESVEAHSRTAKFDLTLDVSLYPRGKASSGSLEYNTDLFDRATMSRLVRHYCNVLRSGLETPDAVPVGRLPMLSSEEQTLVLQTGRHRAVSQADASTTSWRSIVGRFREAAARYPDNIAASDGFMQLSYRELDRRSDLLAATLRNEYCIGPDMIVGLYLERTVALVTAILGILKAGGAYLPMEKAYPSERLSFMLKDSRASVLITQEKLLKERAIALPEGLVVCFLDDNAAVTENEAAADRLSSGDPLAQDSLAYVIYTSGSTGTPKGVMITHNNVTRLFDATDAWYHFNDKDVWALFHSAAFDFSVWELWGALFYGGRLVIVPHLTSRSAASFYRLLCQENVTVLNQTPSAFRQLVTFEEENKETADTSGAGLALRLVIFGGEALEFQSLTPWFERHGDTHPLLVNMYGITETTVHVTYRPVVQRDAEAHDGSLIGEAIPDLTVYVLDPYGDPVPLGVPGELCVGGEGVARGYLGRADLTAARFIPDPFSAAPGARLYRSGDLARLLASGDMEYLGRIDTQVKLRGFRIELGEIEAALKEDPAVSEAVVLLSDTNGSADDRRLVAYLVPRRSKAAGDVMGEEAAIDLARLRVKLLTRLPEYMVPAAYVVMDALPLTANGKLDRRALPLPDTAQPASGTQYSAPCTEAEQVLAGIWQDLLGVEKAGVYDEFFALGGHSLLAGKLVARIRAIFNIEIPLRAIFEHRTLGELARHITSALGEGAAAVVPPVTMVARDGLLPVSFAQQRLWFLDQLEPGSAWYNIPFVFRARGPLDAGLLEESLNRVIAHHESLRSAVETVEGSPVLSIVPRLSVEIPIADVSALPSNEQQNQVRLLVSRMTATQIPMDTAPLFRLLLLACGPEDHVLVMVMHHCIADHWTAGILLRDIGIVYEALTQQRAPELPAVPVQYADYAAWQRRWLQGEALEAQLSYWREQLQDLPPLLELPTDRPRPAAMSRRGAYVPVRLPEMLAADVKAFSRKEGSTPFITLLTAFALLLERYSGQHDFAIGTPVAGRTHTELEGVVGLFVNTLALRVELSGSPTFRSLSRRVRETLLQAFARQDLPFEMVVDALGVERSMSHTPLFQVMFAYENAAALSRSHHTSILHLEPVEAHSGTAKFDLSVSIAEEGTVMTGAWEYNTDLFDHSTIERMSAQFMRLLESALGNADQPVASLEMLAEDEGEDLLRLSTTAVEDLPSPAVFPLLFGRQADRSPEAPAVAYGDAEVSYRALNAEANRIAWRLIALGIGPESLVGLCMERSVALVTALIGILKAGAAYVALDPTYPKERIEMILEDAGIPVIISHRGLADMLSGAHVTVDLDRDAAVIASMSAENPPVCVFPENIAYLIYTSGSTGRPKGVMVQHGSMINLWNGLRQRIYARAGNGPFRITLNAPLLFDASVQQLVMLLDGHCLDVVPQDIRADGEALVEHIRRRRIDVVDCVPSQLNLMLQAGLLDAVSDRVPKVLLPGGEAIDVAMWETLSRASGTVSFNMYGPTECTVDSTICCVHDVPDHPVIGRPLPNVSHYILDKGMMLVPAGVFGELYIGGIGVARGYLHRPALTAERFVPDPFSAVPGSRLYRTGDMVRYRSDGTIEFKGRMDEQVKVRGFRIEPGEIEAALEAHAAVRQCAVVARGDSTNGNLRLGAFVVLRESAERPTTTELREHLRRILPEYMIPASFVTLDALPMTPNGKVNRKALPDLSAAETVPAESYVAPQSPREELLAEIWKEVLGIRRVGVHDNFFESGGDSILCIQVVAKARKSGLMITPRQIFQYPTIAQLTAVVTAAAGRDAKPSEDSGPIPLTPIQCWFFEREFVNPHHWNQSVLFAIQKSLDPAVLTKAVAALVQHHASLRLRFVRTDQGWQQSYAPREGQEIVSFVDLTSCPDDQLSSAIEESTEGVQRSLNITEGPLIRVSYFSTGERRKNRLLIVIHHLAVDGVSWRILLEDLFTAYEQLVGGTDPVLPASSSFQMYARALQENAGKFQGEDEIRFWQGKLGEAQPDIPMDRPGTAPGEQSAETIATTVDASLTSALLHEIPARHRTRADEPLLAALVLAYARWAGRRSLFVNLEGHGRDVLDDLLDLTRTVGWCTIMYPAVLHLGKSTRRVDALMSVREQLRAIPHHGIGYGLLQYAFRADSGAAPLTGLPQPQICFNYLGQFGTDRGEGDALFSAAFERRGRERSRDASMSHLIDITCGIDELGLRLSWTYSRDIHDTATIEHFASLFHEELALLVDECLKTTTEEYVPSDFPMAGLTQDSLRAVLSRVSAVNER